MLARWDFVFWRCLKYAVIEHSMGMEELSGAAARWVQVAAFYSLCLLTLVYGAFIEIGLNTMAVGIFVENGIVTKTLFSLLRQDKSVVVLLLLKFDVFLSNANLCLYLTCSQPLNSGDLIFCAVGE